ncbi:hypothetical protein GXN76_11880 [Kroppenstedtia pulmonis]|uniref:Uncharacterized protein n=1 Tax=Kroppenstedtia pulmonis TaxID=1380685 RepID=A0A7D4BI51_9BACL|nr:hypothetical protein [Kroppenstedtia pulmonis]QKG85095.1 hypothetical protein GXN76_11880 [Kroppenstedtia pulmonis]
MSGLEPKNERINKNGKTEYTVRARPKATSIEFDKEDLYDLSLMAKTKSVEDIIAIMNGENPWEKKQQDKEEIKDQSSGDRWGSDKKEEDKIDSPFDVGGNNSSADDIGDDDDLLADIMNSVKRNQ